MSALVYACMRTRNKRSKHTLFLVLTKAHSQVLQHYNKLTLHKSFEDRVSQTRDDISSHGSSATQVFGRWQVHWWNGRVIWRPPEVYWEMIGQEQVHHRLPSHPRSSGWRRCTGVSPSKSSGVLVVWDIRLTSNPIDILEGHIKLWGTLTPWASR